MSYDVTYYGNVVGGNISGNGSALQNVSGFWNVQAAPYSATGNGTTDDTAAIQAAITAAAAGSPLGGGIVVLPAGKYKTTATITLPSGVTILGCGWGATSQGTIIAPSFSGDVFSAVYPNYADGISVLNLTVQPSITMTAGAIFNFSGAGNVRIDSVYVTACYDFIQLGYSVNVCDQVYVTNCTIGGQVGPCTRYCIHITGICGDVDFVNCLFTGNGTSTYAMYIDTAGAIDPFYMNNCDFEAMAYGFIASGSAFFENAYLEGVILDAVSTGSALSLSPGSGKFAEQIQFVNCWFTSTSTTAPLIALQGGQTAGSGGVFGIQFANCQLVGAGSGSNAATVLISSGASHITFVGCQIGSSGTAPYVYLSNATYTMAGLTFSGCQFGGFVGSGGTPTYGFLVNNMSGTLEGLSISGGSINNTSSAALSITNGGTMKNVCVSGVGGFGNTGSGLSTSGTIANSFISGNSILNPAGALTPPTYTAGSPATNTFPFAVRVSVTGASAVAINGTATGGGVGAYILLPGETITPTGAGSWTWYGL